MNHLLAVMTQEQISALMIACCNYLPAERIASCLREGLEPEEIRSLQNLLVDFDEDEG